MQYCTLWKWWIRNYQNTFIGRHNSCEWMLPGCKGSWRAWTQHPLQLFVIFRCFFTSHVWTKKCIFLIRFALGVRLLPMQHVNHSWISWWWNILKCATPRWNITRWYGIELTLITVELFSTNVREKIVYLTIINWHWSDEWPMWRNDANG